ncbi:MAG: TetR/AcrR family transcriptional regulator [Candidatus Velthaea sp.]
MDDATDARGGALRKGERTRRRIVREAAGLFNTRGFAGTSVADVSAATGLEKGGVYNHFGSKDDLALAAFDYAAAVLRERLETAFRAHADGADRLRAMFDVYRVLSEQPFLKGGCPILNTAVEADDTHPALLRRARAAMNGWLRLVVEALEAGRLAGQFRADLDAAAVANTIVAALEGGILLAKLYREPQRMRTVIDQISSYVDAQRAQPT